MPSSLLSNGQLWAWLAIALATALLVWLLAPILTPFLFAAILAYIFDPLVERLTRRRVPRTLAVVVIFALLAFGQLFGFVGVLLALPAAAALLVGLRHLRAAYLASPLYGER
jgi:predicted PurR-regulated permease PerM